MTNLGRDLFLAGAVPFLVLGTAHALATPLSPGDRKGLSPYDPAVGETMGRTTLRLTRRTDLWRAWVGFNFSHSLGAILFGVVILLIGRDPATYAAQAAAFLPLAVAVAAVYTLLAVRYWFQVPLLGCLASLACLLGAWVLHLTGR